MEACPPTLPSMTVVLLGLFITAVCSGVGALFLSARRPRKRLGISIMAAGFFAGLLIGFSQVLGFYCVR